MGHGACFPYCFDDSGTIRAAKQGNTIMRVHARDITPMIVTLGVLLGTILMVLEARM
jgi:hypothetical protein